MDRCFTNILSTNVERTAAFYEGVLGMRRHFDSDWFVILSHADIENLELAILQRDNDVVPTSVRSAPSGFMLTFVVKDCDQVHDRAVACETEVLEQPKDMFYGQRRMLLRDPDGTVVDVSSPVGSLDR